MRSLTRNCPPGWKRIGSRLASMMLCFLLSLALLLSLLPSISIAGPSEKPCVNRDVLDQNLLYQNILNKNREYVDKVLERICKRTADGRLPKDKAQQLGEKMLLRYGVCDTTGINENFRKKLVDSGEPDLAFNVFNKFCHDTFDVEKFGVRLPKKKQIRWLQVEYFCARAQGSLHPGGLAEVLKPDDLPSFNRLERVADVLCDDLRANRIDVDDAWFRWNQEVLIFKKRLKSDSFKFGMNSLKDLISSLIDIIR